MFYSNVQYIESSNFTEDTDWQEIVSPANLSLAWARTRNTLTRESLVDEIEIHVFEQNLDENLKQIRTELLTYTTQLADIPRFYYKFPKADSKVRIRAIQGTKEDILAVAVVQILNRQVRGLMSRTFAYRVDSRENTEYLYRPWFRSYSKFREAVVRSIQGNDPDKAQVLRTDLRNFFPSISQAHLFEQLKERLHIAGNKRLIWLLDQIISRNIDAQDHKSGNGLVQGAIASGFFANLYLLSLDESFSDDYRDATFFRYVDDMVLVIPDPDKVTKVESDLLKQIRTLDVEIAEEKTYKENAGKVLVSFEADKDLDRLDKQIQKLTDGLYYASPEYHFVVETYDNNQWYIYLRRFQKCLVQLGIFVEINRLSRKVWQYVKDPTFQRKHLLSIPPIEIVPDEVRWGTLFKHNNQEWENDYLKTKNRLVGQLQDNWTKWTELNDLLASSQNNNLAIDEISERQTELKQLQTRISFALNRLARFGYDQSLDIVTSIFCQQSHIFRSHRLVLDHLAIQGHTKTLMEIWKNLETAMFPGDAYLRAMVLRAFRYLDSWTTDILDIADNYVIRAQGINSLEISDSEYLMATETCLLSVIYQPDPNVAMELLRRSQSLVKTKPRIARNLALLAIKSGSSSLDLDFIQESFVDAYEFGISEGWKRINEEPEPVNIRQHYYRSRYPDNADEFEDAYF